MGRSNTVNMFEGDREILRCASRLLVMVGEHISMVDDAANEIRQKQLRELQDHVVTMRGILRDIDAKAVTYQIAPGHPIRRS